jgi:hypothetical protein
LIGLADIVEEMSMVELTYHLVAAHNIDEQASIADRNPIRQRRETDLIEVVLFLVD